jgi:hypothetical protein
MKFAAAILACIVLITSVYPVSKQFTITHSIKNIHSDQYCMAAQHKHCTKTENKPEKNNPKNDCPNGSCSPFSICNYFPVTEPIFSSAITPKFIIANNNFPLFVERIFSNYYAEFWHPQQLSVFLHE